MVFFGVIPLALRIYSLQLVVEVVEFRSHPLNFVVNPLKALVYCIEFMLPKQYNLLVMDVILLLFLLIRLSFFVLVLLLRVFVTLVLVVRLPRMGLYLHWLISLNLRIGRVCLNTRVIHLMNHFVIGLNGLLGN